MTLFLLAVRLALAAIFLTAAGGKLLDREGARQAMRDFGVPARFAPPAALLLPVAEIAIAVALIPTPTGWFGAIGALLLLTAFSAAIALSIARGRAVDCHCFGQLGGGEVGLGTLARNAGFGALALVAIASGPDQDGYGWASDLSTAEQIALLNGVIAIALGLALFAAILALAARLREVRGRLEALEHDAHPAGLPAGTPAPDFALPAVSEVRLAGIEDLSEIGVGGAGHPAAATNGASATLEAPASSEASLGPEVGLEHLRAPGLPVLLAFTSPTCGPCSEFYPELAEWQRDHADAFTVALIASGDPEDNRERAAEHGLVNVLVQPDTDVSDLYESPGTPTAVLIDPYGTIAAPLAIGADEIDDLTYDLRESAEAPASEASTSATV